MISFGDSGHFHILHQSSFAIIEPFSELYFLHNIIIQKTNIEKVLIHCSAVMLDCDLLFFLLFTVGSVGWVRFSWQQTHLQFGQKLIVGFRQNRWMAGIMGGRWQHIHFEIFTVADGWFKTQSVDSRGGWKLEQQLHLAIWKN